MSEIVVPVESSRVSVTMAKPRWLSARTSTFVGLFAGYMGYYLCRQNLSVAAAPMQAASGMSPAEFGMMFGWLSSFGTFAYAIGKVLTGAVADGKLGGRNLFFIGLFGSAAFCFAFGFGTGAAFFVAMWVLNRFFQSMGWGGMANLLSRWYDPATYGRATGVMTLSFQLGGVVASLFAGWILASGGSWSMLFWIPALTLAAMGIFLLPMIKQPPTVRSVAKEAGPASPSAATVAAPILPYKQRFLQLLRRPSFLAIAGLSLLLTFLRECFNLWMPLYFSQLGSSHSAAAFKSAIFPLLGCVGALLGGWASDWLLVRRQKRSALTLSSRELVGSRIPLLVFFLSGLIATLTALSQLESFAAYAGIPVLSLSFVLVGAVGFFLLGAYSFVGGVLALDFGGQEMAGTAAGLLDGAGYLGAVLSGIGVAKLVFSQGWGMTYGFLAVLAALALVLCLVIAWMSGGRSVVRSS